MDFFWVANQKARKAFDNVRVILNKIYGKYTKIRYCGSWFHSHFDNVMTQFIINKRTDA